MKIILGIWLTLFMLPSLCSESKNRLAAKFPEGVLNLQGEKVALENLKGKTIGLYFAARWCGHCKIFTPKLVDYYHKNKKDFEVIYVSSDQNEKEMMKYMKVAKMPWLHLKYKTYPVNWLEYDYNVYETPTFILINDQGQTLVSDAISLVERGVNIQKIAQAKVHKEKVECEDCDEDQFRYHVDL